MTAHDNAYSGLTEAHDDARWAYGTGFDDPLAGIDTTLPAGVDHADLAAYCLMLGDDALVLAQRLAQQMTRAPELEEEMALANVGLDLLGQARFLLTRAAAADPAVVPALPEGSPVPPEDALAYFRDEAGFCNLTLAEAPDADFATVVVRLFVLSAWRLAVLDRLTGSRDPVLAAVAAKAVPELTYHRDYAARWVVTLALGTAESRRRTELALAHLWPYLGELYVTHPVEERLSTAGVGVAPADVRAEVEATIGQLLAHAGLTAPEVNATGIAGRNGVHTKALRPLLAEMQAVARAHPAGRW